MLLAPIITTRLQLRAFRKSCSKKAEYIRATKNDVVYTFRRRIIPSKWQSRRKSRLRQTEKYGACSSYRSETRTRRRRLLLLLLFLIISINSATITTAILRWRDQVLKEMLPLRFLPLPDLCSSHGVV